jgi:hypothetical protein
MIVDTMPILIGLAMAPAIGGAATLLRADRDRALYPVMLIVTASYYVLFAIIGAEHDIGRELLIAAGFVVAAVVGFRRNLWLVVIAFVAHGVLDVVYNYHVVANAGVPLWWPSFCLAFDLAAAAFLTWRLARETTVAPRIGSSPTTGAAS